MIPKSFLMELNYDDEIRTCEITNPLDAIKSDFAKKIFNHISSKGSFAKWFISDITKKLEDESVKLSDDDVEGFLNLIAVHEETFDLIVKRYQGQFPAWVQSAITDDSLDMQQEDHILYENGKYISLEKIKKYVKSRVHNPNETE